VGDRRRVSAINRAKDVLCKKETRAHFGRRAERVDASRSALAGGVPGRIAGGRRTQVAKIDRYGRARAEAGEEMHSQTLGVR